MKHVLSFLLPALTLLCLTGKAQTPGAIFYPATVNSSSPLNPNGDGWTTSTSTAFNGTTVTDPGSFEIAWIPLHHHSTLSETNGDQAGGSQCSITDVMDDPADHKNAYYYAFVTHNSVTYLCFRLRIADASSGSFGFAVGLDLDNKYGSGVDPNYIAPGNTNNDIGNPGFEAEVILNNQNNTVTLRNVDGVKGHSSTLVNTYTGYPYYIYSYARKTLTSCANKTPFFADFCVPVSALASIVPGFTSSSPFFSVAGTTQSGGGSLLAGSNSDIAGINDAPFTNLLSIINELETNQKLVLPVHLTSFNGVNLNGKVQLNWTTGWERDNDHFVIERSADARNFIPLGEVKANGLVSGSTISYTALDEAPLARLNYYRLKQVDKNLITSSYSKIIAVWGAAERPSLYPNPIKDAQPTQVAIKGADASWTLIIADQSGKILYQGAVPANGVLPTMNLSAGTYQYRFETNGLRLGSGKLLVQ